MPMLRPRRLLSVPLPALIAAIAGFALLAGFAAQVATAAVARRATLEALTASSECIVRGRIITSEARWEGGTIYTRHILRVTTCLKGNAATGSQLVVSTLGGQVGDIGQVACGSPGFRAGEDVYLFLRRDGEHRLRVLALNQGKFNVIEDAADPTAPPTVRNNLGGLVIVDATGKKTDAQPLEFSLTDFEARVRQLVSPDDDTGTGGTDGDTGTGGTGDTGTGGTSQPGNPSGEGE